MKALRNWMIFLTTFIFMYTIDKSFVVWLSTIYDSNYRIELDTIYLFRCSCIFTLIIAAISCYIIYESMNKMKESIRESVKAELYAQSEEKEISPIEQ